MNSNNQPIKDTNQPPVAHPLDLAAWSTKTSTRLYQMLMRVRPLAIGVAVLLLATDAWARAGGGGGYTGGGGGSSSGGSSGGGGGDGAFVYLIVRLLIWLCIEVPYVGIPLVIIVIYLFIKSKGAAQSHHQGRTIRSSRRMQHQADEKAAIETIRKRDPEFSPSALTDRIQTAFLKLQHAWCSQDLTPVRQFVSDGIYERFTIQIAEQKELGFRDHMENLQILSTDIAQIESDAVFDTITIKIRASAIDYRADLKTEKRQSGATRPETFVEYWSFVRRLHAKSLNTHGLMEGNCPNCGAGLELNETAVCSSCKTLIKSGEYDWVLAEITQGCEWEAQPQKELPGVVHQQQNDPGFAIQHLEDRASVMFWRHILSIKQGTIAPIQKMATDSFCEQMKPELQTGKDGSRQIYRECAVGGVKTLGLLLDEDGVDKALVKIRWSGQRCELTQEGRVAQSNRAALQTCVYVLERQHGTQSSIDRTLSSAHCPGCGAPAGEGMENACPYCGTVLNDPAVDWVLSHIGSPMSQTLLDLHHKMIAPSPTAEPHASPAAARPPGEGLELAAWMVKVMLADGKIDPKEKAHLEGFAAARNIPKNQMDHLIASAQSGQIEIQMPSGPQEAKSWLVEMAKMALADGFVSKEEKAALMSLGKTLGYSAHDLKQFILQARSEMYKESKTVIKEIKAGII